MLIGFEIVFGIVGLLIVADVLITEIHSIEKW